MKRKILFSLGLIAIMTVLFAITVSAADPVEEWDISATENDSVTAYLYADPINEGMYTLTISGTGNMKGWVYYSSVPWYSSYASKITSVAIEGDIISIGSCAFGNCTSLTSIEIPDSVTSIGSDAFRYCSSLTSIEIPDSVASIGTSAFYGCSSLTGIVIPHSVATIDYWAFSDCFVLTIYAEAENQPGGWDSRWNSYSCPVVWDCKSNDIADDGYFYVIIDGIRYGLKDNAATVAEQLRSTVEINIPTSVIYNERVYLVTAIGNCAFEGCTSLTNVNIPNGVTSIGDYAFRNCSKLTSINLSDNITAIGASAFSGCSAFTSIAIPNSVTVISDSAFANCTKITSIVVPYGVTTIGNSAFNNCSKLTSISIPNSVTSIGTHAFSNCKALSSVAIPDSVASVGDCIFLNCKALTSIDVDENNEYYCSIDGSLYTKDKKILIQYVPGSKETSFVIPTTVEIIANEAFKSCTALTNVVITSNVTSIGDHAFADMTGITSIIIPGNVKTVKDCAFFNCYSLTKVIIGSGVESIGKHAFSMSNVRSIFIPSSVTTLGTQAFYFCSGPIYAEAVSEPDGWESGWDIRALPSASKFKVVWGHAHTASTEIVNNGDGTHTGNCVCGVNIIEEHAFGTWTELDETTMERECICTQKDYLEIEKEEDKVNTKPDKDNVDKDKNKVKIDIVFNETLFDEIGIEIIPEILEQINGMETEINTDLGSVILDAIASSKVAGTLGNVNIGVADITTDKEEKTGHKVFSITVNDENGNPILPPEKDDNGTVTLSLKYQKGLVKEQIKIAYRDENGKLEHMEVEKYDPETGEVTFKTTHLSEYVIYAEELETVYMKQIFTFKGYSFGPAGTIAFGFDIDYEALAKYEEKTGKTLEIGVVFAGYDNLAGAQPLDENGKPIKLNNGMVVKADLTSFEYKHYDFTLIDIADSISDIKLVVAAYIYDGESVKYVQSNGLSDTVTGISYNEAKESVAK